MVGTLPLLLGLLLAVSVPARSATIRVPADQPTIQAGVNAATVGDTVLVGPGTYLENVIVDRRVALLSEAGAEVTTIDGQGIAPTVLVEYDVDHASIEGFRVTGGFDQGWYNAAGIDVELQTTQGGHATIRRNIVEHNLALYGAGGIFAVNEAIVEENVIQYNNEAPTNSISAMNVSGVVERNTIRYNGRNDLRIVWLNGTSTFAWNAIVDNAATNNTVVIQNGGSIHHNTIARNGQAIFGTVLLGGDDPIEFRNNLIVHGNWDGLRCVDFGASSVECNDVWGVGSSYNGECAGMLGSEGNFSEDPLFCEAAGGDYRLKAESPCAPANSPPGCGLIGALPVGCGVAGVPSETPPVDLRLTVIPNPVRGMARFELGTVAPLTPLNIFDSQGRLIEQLLMQDDHWEWSPSSVIPAGIYFARPEVGGVGAAPVKFLYLR